MSKKYNFCIVTYETFPNPSTQNLKTYLLENYNCNLLYIFHPMLDMEEGYRMSSGYNFFENRLVKSAKAYHWQFPWPFLYIKDILYTFFWCLKFKKKFDVYFAAGNLNPVVGIILRELGFIKRVIYICLDYYPTRFKNKFFNWLYFQFDRFCVRFSDETWNVSPVTAEAREKKMGMKRIVYNRQYTVRGGIWFYKIKRLSFSKVDRNKIVYRGMLSSHMGVDLAIEAIPLILKKIPKLIFEIVGTGPDEKRLRNLTKSLGVSKNVLFHGFVKERSDVEKILSDGALGIATFNIKILDNINSDPGKIKDYMLLGMPVITANNTWYGKEIVENRCGMAVSYSPEQVAGAVIKLLKNNSLLKKYRQNSIQFIERFDCASILRPNIDRVLNNLY